MHNQKETSGVKRVIIEKVECKSILSKSHLEDYCINPYIGCQHACKYCYAESYTRRFTKHEENWGDFVDVKINAPDVLAREVKKKPRGAVFLSSLTDAYQPVEREYDLTRKLLEILLQHQFPISIQTKSALVLRDLDLIRKFHRREVGFTITMLNDDVRKLFEPNSSSVSERLHAIAELRENGVKTFVFFGPILPYVSDQDLEEYFHQIVNVGTDYLYVDKLNLKPGLWVKLKSILQKDFSPLCERWEPILLGKSNYYDKTNMRIKSITKKLGLKCKFGY